MRAFAVRRSFIPKHNSPRRRQNWFRACGRCGLMFRRHELRLQRGLLVDSDCFDDLSNEKGR